MRYTTICQSGIATWLQSASPKCIIVVTTIQTSAVAETATQPPRDRSQGCCLAPWLAKYVVAATQQPCDWVAWRLRGSFCYCRRFDRGDYENTRKSVCL
ncbi:hypothetical protein Y032_0449g1658 [Ancylostoma ceylanicum]|uniref:Uncharacterized protein n=1 Tax=Ancylostoma ceylanicum TaxID=53326 RepID=A0A016WYR0_9BILA|nr:hypothetical protein Y032_0449g1658 [Ancylostoma ceylanicum]